MSRLIEALRKAEEAKRKDEQNKTDAVESTGELLDEKSLDENTKTELSISTADDESQQSATTEPDPQFELDNEHSVDFELEPTDSGSAKEIETEAAATEAENISNSSSLDFEIEERGQESEITKDEVGEPEQASAEPASTAEPIAQPESSSSQEGFARRQTDTIHPDISQEREEPSDSKKRVIWILVIGLLILILGAAYFLLFVQNSQSQYPSSSTQSRGFLEDRSSQDNSVGTRETPQSSTAIAESEDETSLIEAARNLLEGATTEVSDDTVETISAVNALLETGSASQQQASERSSTILSIKRSNPLEGASTSLSYAQDNALGGELSAARMEYQELLRNQPTNMNALMGLANIESQTGNKALARRLYGQVLQLAPQAPLAQLGLLENRQSYDALVYETELKSIASRNTDEAFIPFKLGKHYAAQNRWNEARNAFDSALRIASQQTPAVNPDYAFNLAVALEKTLRPEQALEKYKEARKLSENSAFSFDADLLNSRIDALEKRAY